MQKLTILDTARLAAEIRCFAGARAGACGADGSRSRMYLVFSDRDEILKIDISKKSAYIGQIDELPTGSIEIFPQVVGKLLTNCEQVSKDRILKMVFEGRDRLGRIKTTSLICELIPNRGNVFLIGEDGSLKGNLRNKEVETYSPPKALGKSTVFEFDDRELTRLIEAGSDISKDIMGLSHRDLAILKQAFHENPNGAGAILINYVNKAVRPGPAWIIFKEGKPAGFSLVEPVLTDDEEAGRFDSALTMYDAYYSETESSEVSEGELNALLKTLDSRISRFRKKLWAIEKELSEAQGAEKYKIFGELILANIGEIRKGQKRVGLKSITQGGEREMEIELDPAKSPSVNAANYFKRYRKAVSSTAKLRKRLEETKGSLAILEEIRQNDPDDIESLRERMIELGLISADRKKAISKRPPPRKAYRTFRASCGWDILVGKSNADNDELSLKIAAKDDYWFHAWQAAGSHVVLRLPDRKAVPDKQTLLEAASLAAWYSKARGSSKVAVIYTQAKYVRKPRKFAPGKVIVEREKQLMVRPTDPKGFGAEGSG